MIHVLVIDDDRHMRVACIRALEKAGWSATGAESGDEGLRELRDAATAFDLVLLDQLMPGLSGMDTLAQIRNLYAALPVIIMTGFTTEEATRDLKQQGAYDCLCKPFTPDQLRDIVRRASGETGSAGISPAGLMPDGSG
jgi:DNA-binding NtrC family response regulator